ncbi:alkylglycerol monooxygenase-like [Penaeus japonicus]|uniref:alkylglycerol monooxygenase-like n=1 Tax=Penaeus japonicus TaxID=27405 RepID=UPI001C711AD0|nr:alkylglycerol monooxygenase-like [Penaeus japonicus]
MIAIDEALRRLGTLFYVVFPSSSSFRTVKEVPNYINEAIPWFIVIVLAEEACGRLQGRQLGRMCDNVTSLGHATLYESFKLLTRWWEMSGYLWLYEYRLLDLEFSSSAMWFAGFFAADFVYYWFHRASHEVSLIWAWHQVHHSHEDYNVTVALRQSMFQRLFSLGFYQPMALLGVPLPSICVHFQLNLLAQFVIHTELVDRSSPGVDSHHSPLHHQVLHHGTGGVFTLKNYVSLLITGANKYCLDKNYGGVLIIWDRIFGTFQEEKQEEEIVYGLVHQPQTSNVLWLQFFYIRNVLRKASSMRTWRDSFRALLCGPGWSPGTPRLGDLEAFPDVRGRAKYDPQIALWQKGYSGAHYLVALLLQQVFTFHFEMLSKLGVLVFFVFLLVTIGNITALYDEWQWAPLVEVIRCASFVAFANTNSITGWTGLDTGLATWYAVSSLVWLSPSVSLIQKTFKRKRA